MAVLNGFVRRSPHEVWKVLADGWSYVDWVTGTRAIRAVDDAWPDVGASLVYEVGRGPLSLRDKTTVRIAVPEHKLELEAHAGVLGTARISIEVLPWGDGAVVIFDEHPLRGPGASWHNSLAEMALRFRNRETVRRLVRLIEQRHPR